MAASSSSLLPPPSSPPDVDEKEARAEEKLIFRKIISAFEEPDKKEPTCPRYHMLNEAPVPVEKEYENVWLCDCCGAELPPQKQMYVCLECNFSLCQECYVTYTVSLYQACVDTDEAEAEVSRERARSVVKEEETKESANERCQATEEVENHM